MVAFSKDKSILFHLIAKAVVDTVFSRVPLILDGFALHNNAKQDKSTGTSLAGAEYVNVQLKRQIELKSLQRERNK